jgi:hypothetical protein
MSTENTGYTFNVSGGGSSEPVTIHTAGIVVPSTPSIDYLVEVILHQHFNQLKARLMNLTEACLPETRQCNALKGLIKDALNQCYYNGLHEVNGNLRQRGVIPVGMDHSPVMGLDAKGLSDIMVD